jgi:hypothetical protein
MNTTSHMVRFAAFRAFGCALVTAVATITAASAETSRPGVAQRPPTNLKLDQVDSVKGAKRTLVPAKIEYPNARAKGGNAVK